jgi:hypothetical protein
MLFAGCSDDLTCGCRDSCACRKCRLQCNTSETVLWSHAQKYTLTFGVLVCLWPCLSCSAGDNVSTAKATCKTSCLTVSGGCVDAGVCTTVPAEITNADRATNCINTANGGVSISSTAGNTSSSTAKHGMLWQTFASSGMIRQNAPSYFLLSGQRWQPRQDSAVYCPAAAHTVSSVAIVVMPSDRYMSVHKPADTDVTCVLACVSRCARTRAGAPTFSMAPASPRV